MEKTALGVVGYLALAANQPSFCLPSVRPIANKKKKRRKFMALGTLLGAHSNSSTCHLCKPYYDTFGSGGKEQKRSRAKGGGDRGFHGS